MNRRKKGFFSDTIRTITARSGITVNTDVFTPHEMSTDEVAEHFDVKYDIGLSGKRVKNIRSKTGYNIITPELKRSLKKSIVNQILGLTEVLMFFSSLLMYAFDNRIYYLVFAAALPIIVLFNALTEKFASAALEKTRNTSTLKTTVIRDGKESVIDSLALVPGDIIKLKAGNIVPADARIVSCTELFVLETPLTGKKSSVSKNAEYISLGKRLKAYPNMLYARTIITSGYCTAIVCKTAEYTAIRQLHPKKSAEHLPQLLEYVHTATKYFSIFSISVSFILLLLAMLTGRDIVDLYYITLAVASTALCNTANALAFASMGFGAKRIKKSGAAIRNFNCISRLCRVNSIMCYFDVAFPIVKMTARRFCNGKSAYYFSVKYKDYSDKLLLYAYICSRIKNVKEGTICDKAIESICKQLGMSLDGVRERYPVIEAKTGTRAEIDRILVQDNEKRLFIIKGSPELIIRLCADYDLNGVKLMTDSVKELFYAAANKMSENLNYVIAVAYAYVSATELDDPAIIRRMTLLGLLSFETVYDEKSSEGIYKCNVADVEIVVSSAESYYTTFSLAESMGVIRSEEEIISAEELISMNPGMYIASSPNYKVYLNLSCSQWLDVLTLRKQNKKTVAVTAKTTDDLLLMTHSDVSFVAENAESDALKQSADVVLLTDGFFKITAVLQKARSIFKRIHSVTEYLTVCNFSLLLCLFVSILFGLPMPLRAQDILIGGIIINFVIALSLAFAPTSRSALKDKLPKHTSGFNIQNFIPSIMYSVGVSACIGISYSLGNKNGVGESMALITLIGCLFLYSGMGFSFKSFKNYLLLFSLLFIAAVIGCVMYLPTFQTIFGYISLSAYQLLSAFGIAFIYFTLFRITGIIINIKNKKERSS